MPASAPILISEFRTRGPNGANDEFVEIYNNTDAAMVISGWTLAARQHRPSDSRDRARHVTLPARSTICSSMPRRRGTRTRPGNKTYGTGISDDGGVALALPDTTIVDQVGVTTTTGFREGTALQYSSPAMSIAATSASPEPHRRRSRTRTTTAPTSS